MNTELDTEALKQLFTKYRAVLVPILAGASALLIIGLVLIPQILSYFTTSDEILNSQSQATTLEVKAEELAKLDDSGFSSGLATVESVLPAEPDIPSAIAYLEDLIKKSALGLIEVEYLPSTVGASNNFRLVVRATGDLTRVRNFLLNLKNAPRVFQVETIRLQRGVDSTEVEIPITVYYGSVQIPQSSPDAPVSDLTESEKELLNQLRATSSYRISSPTSASASALPASADQFVPVADTSSVPLGKLDPFE